MPISSSVQDLCFSWKTCVASSWQSCGAAALLVRHVTRPCVTNLPIDAAQLTHLFHFFHRKCPQMKIFLSPRLFCPFSLLLAPFSKTCQFQITHLLSTTYLKNTPSPTRLQRLPRSKKSLCDPLLSPLFRQHRLCCSSISPTLKLNIGYIEEQSRLSLLAYSPAF